MITYSESSLSDSSNDSSFNPLDLSFVGQSLFEDAITICQELCSARNRQKPLKQFFTHFTLTRVAISIDVVMRLEVIYDFSGDQSERGRLYDIPQP